jgi:hypothetical protein
MYTLDQVMADGANSNAEIKADPIDVFVFAWKSFRDET